MYHHYHRSSVVYICAHPSHNHQPSLEKVAPHLLHGTITTLAFHIGSSMLILQQDDQIRHVIQLTPSEGLIYLLLYHWYPAITPDWAFATALLHKDQEKDLDHSFPYELSSMTSFPLKNESDERVRRIITTLRFKLRQAQIGIQRVVGTGYLLYGQTSGQSPSCSGSISFPPDAPPPSSFPSA